jgi:cyclopropane fatty-acyl-phospholipid synthase-like methyltransferase
MIFVDLAKEAAALAAAIPHAARVLDIGGGDGEHLNHLLALRPDLRITTLDPKPAVGEWIEGRFEHRVTRLAGTSLAQYLALGSADPDAILMADVLHHIPKASRETFLDSIRVLLERVPRLRIIVKDVEPGSWRARLGVWSDRYITGDLDVSLISRENLVRLFNERLGPLCREDTNLFETDQPNYAITFHRATCP